MATVRDWDGRSIPAVRAADVEVGDRLCGVWGRIGAIVEVTPLPDERILIRWDYQEERGGTTYSRDTLLPVRDPLRGYAGVYLGD